MRPTCEQSVTGNGKRKEQRAPFLPLPVVGHAGRNRAGRGDGKTGGGNSPGKYAGHYVLSALRTEK